MVRYRKFSAEKSYRDLIDSWARPSLFRIPDSIQPLQTVTLSKSQLTILQELSRDIQNRETNNYLIVGEPGSGKTTLLNQLIISFDNDESVLVHRIDVSTLFRGKSLSVYAELYSKLIWILRKKELIQEAFAYIEKTQLPLLDPTEDYPDKYEKYSGKPEISYFSLINFLKEIKKIQYVLIVDSLDLIASEDIQHLLKNLNHIIFLREFPVIISSRSYSYIEFYQKISPSYSFHLQPKIFRLEPPEFEFVFKQRLHYQYEKYAKTTPALASEELNRFVSQINETRVGNLNILKTLSKGNIRKQIRLLNYVINSDAFQNLGKTFEKDLTKNDVIHSLMLGPFSYYSSNNSAILNLFELSEISKAKYPLLSPRILIFLNEIQDRRSKMYRFALSTNDLIELFFSNGYPRKLCKDTIAKFIKVGLLERNEYRGAPNLSDLGQLYIHLLSEPSYLYHVSFDTSIPESVFDILFLKDADQSVDHYVEGFLEYLVQLENKERILFESPEINLISNNVSNFYKDSYSEIMENLKKDYEDRDVEIYIEIKDENVSPLIVANLFESITQLVGCPPNFLNISFLESGSFKGAIKSTYKIMKKFPELLKRIFLIEEQKKLMEAKTKYINAKATNEEINAYIKLVKTLNEVDEAKITMANKMLFQKNRGTPPTLVK